MKLTAAHQYWGAPQCAATHATNFISLFVHHKVSLLVLFGWSSMGQYRSRRSRGSHRSCISHGPHYSCRSFGWRHASHTSRTIKVISVLFAAPLHLACVSMETKVAPLGKVTQGHRTFTIRHSWLGCHLMRSALLKALEKNGYNCLYYRVHNHLHTL